MVIPKLAKDYLLLLKDFSPNQIKSHFFHSVLETQQDGVVEFSEFIEVLLLLEQHKGKTLEQFEMVVKEVRRGVVCDPESPEFGKTSKMQVPQLNEDRRAEFKEAFKFLDAQAERDGVISEDDFLTAMKKHVWG